MSQITLDKQWLASSVDSNTGTNPPSISNGNRTKGRSNNGGVKLPPSDGRAKRTSSASNRYAHNGQNSGNVTRSKGSKKERQSSSKDEFTRKTDASNSRTSSRLRNGPPSGGRRHRRSRTRSRPRNESTSGGERYSDRRKSSVKPNRSNNPQGSSSYNKSDANSGNDNKHEVSKTSRPSNDGTPSKLSSFRRKMKSSRIWDSFRKEKDSKHEHYSESALRKMEGQTLPQHVAQSKSTDTEGQQRFVIENNVTYNYGGHDGHGGGGGGDGGRFKQSNNSDVHSFLSSCLSSRKVVIIIIIYAIIATGLWGFLFNRSFSFPGANQQSEDLKEQVTILDKENDELEAQVDRLQGEVSRLNKETARLELINEDLETTSKNLNQSVHTYQAINDEITASLERYEVSNVNLSNSLSEAEDINEILSDSISALDDKIDDLNSLKLNLTSVIDALETQNGDYLNAMVDLQNLNIASKAQIDILQTELVELNIHIDELDQSHDNLVSILSFMTETGVDMNITIDVLTDYLGNEINSNTVLVLLSLEHSYQNVYSYWTASGLFDDLFDKKSWMIDKDLPIGANEYQPLMDYIDEYVISELCANRTDFEYFLANDSALGSNGVVPPVDLTFRSIRSGIERYFSSLIAHYFSFDGSGVSKLNWMEASYGCENLAAEQHFIWS